MGKRYLRDGDYPEDRDDWESGHHEIWMTDHDPEAGMADQIENEPGYRFNAELPSLRGLEYGVRNNEPEERRAQGRAARKAGPYKWHYDDTGWYAYVLLNGDEALRDAAAAELRRAGISYLIPGRSHKPADNGKRYEWYVRVGYAQEHPSAQIVGDALANVRGLVPDRPEEDQRLLRRDQELEAKALRLQHLLEAERSRIRGMAARLKEGEEERRLLIERSSAQYKTLTDAIATLRLDNQRLSSIGRELQQRVHNHAAVSKETRDALLRVEAETKAKEEEFDEWLSHQEDLLRDLQGGEEKRKALEDKIEELEQENGQLAERARQLEERLAGTNRERDEVRADLARTNAGGNTKRGRIEQAYDESVRRLAPNLEFVNEDSVDALANRFETCEPALALLRKLDSEPGRVEWKSVKGTRGWREACDHFRTGRSKGTADDGRLYFRKQDGSGTHNYLVHIAKKGSQKKDIELLKKHAS